MDSAVNPEKASENIQCHKCGKPFVSQKIYNHILKVSEEKHLNQTLASSLLCPECCRMSFARELIGDRLQKVPRVRHVAKRRKESLEPVRIDARTGATVYKSTCFICNAGCDTKVWMDDGRVIKVEGDPSSPITKGTLCAKGLSSKDILYHPDRLRYPMKRIGERGEGKWQRVTWDEALDTMATRFAEIEQKYGSDGIGISTGTSRGWVGIITRFANAWGKQWTGPGVAQCYTPRTIAQSLTIGPPAIECPDFDSTQLVLVWGGNPPATWNWKAAGMMEAWARGAKFIVVDPVMSESAAKAHMWLQIRPGTDAALALAMLNVIINEELFDKEFVSRWCLGFDELKKRVQEYLPEKVEEITWIPREQIVAAARLYATTKPACIQQLVAMDQNADTISTCRATAILAAITGNVDVPGGNIFPMPLPARATFDSQHNGAFLLTREMHDKRLGSKEYPLLADDYAPASAHNAAFWRAILTGKPYPIRGLYNQGSDILTAFANTNMVREALLSLDFFVVVDLFLTPTAELADLLLPAASWLERSMVHSSNQISYNNVHMQQKVVDLDECWSDYKILNEAAKRLGFGDLMFQTEEDYYDFVLEPSGMKWEDFRKKGIISVPVTYRKYEKEGFKTPSGKVELYSQTFKEMGFDPLPGHVEPAESPFSKPELAKEYPLILTTGAREPVYRHSELRNIPALRQIWPEPRIKINPRTAQTLGIKQGDTLVIETLRGSAEGKAWLREDIDPRVIQAPSHWPGKCNINLVTDNEQCAPAMGSAQLRCQLCKVRKAE